MGDKNPKTDPAKIMMRNQRIVNAIEEAQLLLAYASRSGISLEHDVIEAVVTAKADGTMSEEAEIKFWKEFNKLAIAVCPATAESLLAMTAHPKSGSWLSVWWPWWGRKTLVRRAVSKYSLLALLSLIALLVIQIYWVCGTSVTSDIKRTSDRIKEVETKMQAIQKITEVKVLKKSASIRQGASASAEKNNEQNADAKEANIELEALKNENKVLQQQISSSYKLLDFWSFWGEWTFGKHAGGTLKKCDNGNADEFCEYNVALYQASTIALDTLQRSILPLLYGLLGACVYILRTLSARIKSYTYTETSNINLGIRLFLGILGGMVFAWFVIPENTSGVFKSLSPFALAFLAGYSVELVFASMDRFIGAFTEKKPAAPAKSTK